MRTQVKRSLLIALVVGGLCSGVVRAQDSRTTLESTEAVLGAKGLNSIRISGRGSEYMFGQAYDGDSAWPRFNLTRYSLAINFTNESLRDERTRTQAQNPPLGGANQPIGEQRQTSALSGAYAWNIGAQGSATPAGLERDLRTAVASRQTQIWLTPQGFIKAALAANASVTTETVRGTKKTVISFTTPNNEKLVGTLDEQGLVERIETWFDTPVLGDTKLDAFFQDYKDFNGVKFPTRILQQEGGYPVLDVTITDVKPNAAEPIDVPDNIKQSKGPVFDAIKPEKLCDGIWSIPSNSYQAPKTFAVEFQDHIVVIEAPDSEERSIAAIAAIKKVIPNKPIAYIVNTHTHFDHSGGLRTYADEGATIITYWQNIPYYQQVWANPRTIHPDRLAKSGRKPVFEGLIGSRVLKDESRELDIYHYAGNFHNPGMLMVYLPKEAILIEADSFNPPNNPGDPPTAIPNLVQFYSVVEALGLDVEQIVPIHGRRVTLGDARKAIESYKNEQLWHQ
jgi:glyoxylase-like metal-dependent hydrolase (beta-lactamase superfamily II)